MELKIRIKDCERKLEREFLIYEPVTFVDTDPIIMKCVQELIEEFKGEPEDIQVRGLLIYK